jgi:hypothetical protein
MNLACARELVHLGPMLPIILTIAAVWLLVSWIEWRRAPRRPDSEWPVVPASREASFRGPVSIAVDRLPRHTSRHTSSYQFAHTREPKIGPSSGSSGDARQR